MKTKYKLRLEQDCLEFDAVLRGGVCTIPAGLVKTAEAAAKLIGKTIADWEGNFTSLKALFAQPYGDSDDEAEFDAALDKLQAAGFLAE